MNRVLTGACLIFSVAFAVTLGAQATPPAGQAAAMKAPAKIASDADYMAHMKEIGQLNGMLGKAIKGNMPDEASQHAVRLEVLFKNIHGYWSAKKVDDATAAAQTAVTGLQELQKALAAKDMTAAETARAKFASACMTCHTAHREKTPEGGWRIK